MASGWNLWVWVECIGVVNGCSLASHTPQLQAKYVLAEFNY